MTYRFYIDVEAENEEEAGNILDGEVKELSAEYLAPSSILTLMRPLSDAEIDAYARQGALEDVFSGLEKEEDGTGELYEYEEIIGILREDEIAFLSGTELWRIVYDDYENYSCEMLLNTIRGKEIENRQLIRLGRDGKGAE